MTSGDITHDMLSVLVYAVNCLRIATTQSSATRWSRNVPLGTQA